MTTDTITARAPRRRRLVQRREALAGFLFVLPVVTLFLVFKLFPVFGGILISLGDYKISGAFEFMGLENYREMLSDAAFWRSFSVTVAYTVAVVPLLMIISISLALLVRRVGPFIKFFRAAYFIPSITSLVLAGAVFVWVFNAGGIVPNVAQWFGGDGRSWLGHPVLALVAIIFVAVWGRFGFDMLIVLARLQDLPRELDEASLIDGANGWQRFWFVTFPQLKPQLFFLLVIETTFSFQVFDVVFVMTGGGPAGATNVLGMLLYEEAFRLFNFGYAAAVGVAMCILLVTLALLQRAVMSRGD
ncbi:sugar ABC transporter permease [Tessaracoccus sp. OS52]|uniref:carbohydrate ABC transporter permease n=1 Tax=Tessaracoccus sp. OS52 TaxID=2886691 RepID=UPI001D11ED00|nr:sugar ABC transporter permease [Tessaracoccus sp. OS52]MCC2592068.1 sugar ABC transporter permease [Tessaracoccus sp. OS52]